MAGILAGTAAYFRSCSMVNSIMTAQWMGTGKNGAPRPIISKETESGDCVRIRAAEYYSGQTIFPGSFLFLSSFVYLKGNGSLGINFITKNGDLVFCGFFVILDMASLGLA